MLKKVLEGAAALAIVVIAFNLMVVSVRPYLPYLGIVVLLIITGVLLKLAFFRKKFW